MNTTMNATSIKVDSEAKKPSNRWDTTRRRLGQYIMMLLVIESSQTNGQTFQHSGGEPGGQQTGVRPAAVGHSEPLRPIFPLQPMAEGPGVDLVAFNRRRFELEHNHEASGDNLGQQLRRGQSIEAELAALSNRLMAAAPGDMTKQLLESVNVDSSLITGITSSLASPDESPSSMDDPDGASIARLTKSCLTVHASSARPDQLDVKFYLYTKSNPTKAHLLTAQVSRQELLQSSPFDPRKPIKWITHGFHTNVDKSEWMVEAKDKILQYEDANVILTDWRRGASPALAFYPKAAANAHVVAKFIVRILRRLKDDIDLSQVHLIGHSLGAHIMGFVGSAFTEEHLMRQQQQLSLPGRAKTMFWRTQVQPTKLLVGRITACDPALPCFGPTSSGPVKETNQPGPAITYRDSEQPQLRQQKFSPSHANTKDSSGPNEGPDWTPSMWTHLRPDSAIIVEVMHSNPGFMGYADPLGDFDFYPNGFERQPGCGSQQESGASKPSPVVPGAEPQVPNRRMKRQWASVLDGFMSTVVHPFVWNAGRHQAEGQSATMDQQSLPLPPPRQQQQATSSARAESSRFSQTLDKFLNPIKSFFKGNTCSHHRSVEYMVESLYYDRIAQDRKLDRDNVCQMVGYRCQDYASFKKGFCFRCLNSELDCRAFGMSKISDESLRSSQLALHRSLRSSLGPSAGRQMNLLTIGREKFGIREPTEDGKSDRSTNETHSRVDGGLSFQPSKLSDHLRVLGNTTRRIVKRVLPTYDHYDENYQPQGRNQYFFDTRSSKSFCLHHYSIHIKYRWFRVRDNIMLDGFRLMGTLANLNRQTPIQLNKFSHNSYTALLSEPLFLGQIESLVMFGARVKPTLIDYIEVTFMSNLDPKIRALGSAKLCRAQNRRPSDSSAPYNQATNDQMDDQIANQPPVDSLFVRCSGSMVR